MKSEFDHKERTISEAVFSHTTSVFKRPSYLYVFPAIFVYFLVLFGVFPLATQIHIRQVCSDLNEDDCESSSVSIKASNINLYSGLAQSIAAILVCGFYGSVADVYGRKITIIMPLLGLLAYTSAYLYVDTLNPSNYFAIIMVANVLAGLSGGYFTFIMGVLCYTSDATMMVPHTRRSVYSYAEATITTPQVFGPVLTGIWASYYGFFLPLLLGVILTAVAIVYVAILPESLPPDAHSRTLSLALNPFQTFSNFAFLFSHKMLRSAKLDLHSPISNISTVTSSGKDEGEPKEDTKTGWSPVPFISLAFLLYFTAVIGQVAVTIVYATHRFGWDSDVIGIYDGMYGAVVALSMVCAPTVVQTLSCRAKPAKLITWIQVGLFFRAIHWCLFGLVKDTVGIFVLLPLLFFVGPLAPYTRTIMSNSVAASEQARIFSAFSALEGMSSLLSPLYSAAYSLFVQADMPEMVFETMALASVVALCIATYVRMTPSLAQHLPEDLGGAGLAEVGESEEDAVVTIDEEGNAEDTTSALLYSFVSTGAAGTRLRHRSRSVSSVLSTASSCGDTSTLLYCHLARPSADWPVDVVRSSDHGVAAAAGACNPLTARLLAEPLCEEEAF